MIFDGAQAPDWVGWIGIGFGLWLVTYAFRKAPAGRRSVFNYMRPKRLVAGLLIMAAGADIAFF